MAVIAVVCEKLAPTIADRAGVFEEVRVEFVHETCVGAKALQQRWGFLIRDGWMWRGLIGLVGFAHGIRTFL